MKHDNEAEIKAKAEVPSPKRSRSDPRDKEERDDERGRETFKEFAERIEKCAAALVLLLLKCNFAINFYIAQLPIDFNNTPPMAVVVITS